MSKIVCKFSIFLIEIKFLSKYFVFLRLHFNIIRMKTFAKVLSLVIILALCPIAGLRAQNKADSLRKAYDFAGAVDLCGQMISSTEDSLEREMWDASMVLAQNGLSMTEFCLDPEVVAKVRLPIKDFHLFYPMQAGSWYPVPNQLDSSEFDGFAQALYFPRGADEIYFSAPDSSGFRNIYQTQYLDSLWSVPESVYDMITSQSNEIYPLLSPDGQTLFFASDGLYGMGGYDIYSTTWNPDNESWEMPVNLGFPFSSPYDDFLFYNTPDGKYSIFASNRETSRDSVNIYVLAYDSNPIRRAINDTDRLREIASLNPKTSAKIDNTSAVRSSLVENSEVQKYSLQADLVKSLRDSLYRFHDQINVAELQGRLNEAIRTLQRLEMDFLSSGLSFDLSALQKETQRQVVGVKSGFTFSKNEPGSEFHLDIEQPEPSEEDAAAAAAAARQKQNARRSKAKPVEITRYNLVITPANGRALSSAAISAIRSCTSKDIIRHLDDGVVTFRIGQFDTPDPIHIIIEQLARNGEQNCTIQEETITVQQP